LNPQLRISTQIEDSADAFLCGPRFFGADASSLASIMATMPATSQSRSVTPVATACVTRSFDLYYLNTMAGPKRMWRFHNDPAHEWLMA
jgi:5-deoxy-D-glucuronate isomerase